ncbi:MAG: hypothetical protein IPO88_20470 [Nannocystis sp.]|uniref:hypothetical protein n=1 Tax=Nannocystis sp. TaxID=1962667 RepID=UPI0024215C19|nr:hypothetical protein [Nannocystis sp.]MBK9755833.1 hypothetical protein [Nannocystis sp.]
MTASTHIHALSARYIVPRGDPRAAPRLGRLLRRVLDEALEPALERAGVPLDATVCVRSVASHATLELRASDDALVLAWSLDLSHAIATAVDRGAADVAVFTSPHHALVAFATDLAAADLTRAWAYRQLGFGDLAHTSPSARADLLVRALTQTPSAIVPILVDLAQRGRLASLVAPWTPAHWHSLAHAAAHRHGLDPTALLTTPTDRHVPSDISSPNVADDNFLTRALLALALPPGAHQAAAFLATLAAGPTTSQRLANHVDALVRRLTARAACPPLTLDSSAPVASVDRPTGATELGGLLFLIHILAALDLPTELAADPTFAHRSPRWVLHRLALALTPANDSDPAVLAFAGLPPDAPPPSRDEPPATSSETDRLDELACRITAALHVRLGEPPQPASVLLDWVCRRPARIVADPGWFAVHLSLRRVDTGLRRAGLDLDPDFVPWLGVVLKFIYA